MEETQGKKLLKPRYCSVPQCDSREYRKLHRFPNDPEMQQKWAIACCLGRPVKKNMAVCGYHFLKSDYIPRWDGNVSRLKKIAVPSQNLPTKSSDKKLSSEQIERREARAKRATKRLSRNDNISIPTSNKKIVTTTTPTDSKSNDSNESDQNTEQANVMVSHVPIPIKKDIRVLNIQEVKDAMKPKVCKCKNPNSPKFTDESDETSAAKILVELNEKVWALYKNNDITIPMKNVILKLGEEFYFAARRYRKSTFVHHLQNDNQIYCFTGTDSVLLSDLLKAVTVCESDNADDLMTVYDLSAEERILLCLVKIRMNLSFGRLAQFFRVTEATCKNLFVVTLEALKSVLKSAIYWPTADEVTRSMPDKLSYLKKTVAVADSIQITTEKSICSACGYPLTSEISDEKFKILIGFANCGLITYVGKAQAGKASNEIIADDTMISKVLVPNDDAIMSNGFLVEQKCNKVLIHLIKSRKELSFCQTNPFQVKMLRPQAIESAMKRFKMFKILQSALPSEMVPYLDDISVVICGIVNLSNPVLFDIKV